jgi:hypothetical protein
LIDLSSAHMKDARSSSAPKEVKICTSRSSTMAGPKLIGKSWRDSSLMLMPSLRGRLLTQDLLKLTQGSLTKLSWTYHQGSSPKSQGDQACSPQNNSTTSTRRRCWML